MFCGSAIATQSESPSNPYGTAATRSRTCSGITAAASGSTPVVPSSTTGSWCLAAMIRAIASLEARPWSTSTCTTAVVRPCSRTSASFDSGIRPVLSSRSMTSSPMSCEVGASAGEFILRPERDASHAAAPLSCQPTKVQVEEALPREQRDQAACRKKRREGDRELPGALAVPCEHRHARDDREEQREHESDPG